MEQSPPTPTRSLLPQPKKTNPPVPKVPVAPVKK